MSRIFITFVLAFCLSATLSQAQDSFLVLKNPVELTTAGNTDDPADYIIGFETHIRNLSTDPKDSILIEWTYLHTQTVQPTGWEVIGICDNIVCRAPGDPALTGTPSKGKLFDNSWDNDMLMELNVFAPESGPDGVGTYYIEVKTAFQTDTIVYILTKQSTSINGVTLKDSRVSLFPNPVTNSLHVFANQELNASTLSIYNVIGKEIFSQPVNAQQEVTNLDVSSLSAGLYFVQISDKNGRVITSRKFTKN